MFIDHLCIFSEEISTLIVAYFKIRLLIFLLFGCRGSLHILNNGHISDIFNLKIFSPILCHFWWYHLQQKTFNFYVLPSITFFYVAYIFFVCDISKKSLSTPRLWRLTSMFSFNSFIVLIFKLRFMIDFDLIFVDVKGKGSKFIPMHVGI